MTSRFSPLLHQRLFNTSARARATVSSNIAVAQTRIPYRTHVATVIGRVVRWCLPTMAFIALGTTIFIRRATTNLDAANRHIGLGVTNALHEANRKVHMAFEPTQEEKNQMLMDTYGDRSSLEDMERAIAALQEKKESAKDKAKTLEEAYGGRGSIRDLERAMEIYEVQ